MISSNELYVVTGVTGRTGAHVARTLLSMGKRVRVVVRKKSQGDFWKKHCAEIAVADLSDSNSLCAALLGADAAYIVSPPQYSHDNLFEQAQLMAMSIFEAIKQSHTPKLVVLSSIGAEQTSHTGWIKMNHMLEQVLSETDASVAFLRASYFMENWGPLINLAKEQKILHSFLAPIDQTFPMIATEDIGRIAAQTLCENWQGKRIIEIEGPKRYSPIDVAALLSKASGETINPMLIAQANWPQAVSNQGFSSAALSGFIEMTQGLNSGHIRFHKNNKLEHKTGSVPLNRLINTIWDAETI